MKYFVLLAAVAMITEIVSFFPISTATIVKEANDSNVSQVPQCLWVPSLLGWWVTLTSDSSSFWITFSIPVNYPNDLPIFEVEGHGALSFQKADELYELLMAEAFELRHQTMIYNLVEKAKEFVETNVVKAKTVYASFMFGSTLVLVLWW